MKIGCQRYIKTNKERDGDTKEECMRERERGGGGGVIIYVVIEL